MARDWAYPFYHSQAWQKERMYILQRDNFICTEPGCHQPATEVHHIIELTEDNVNDINICLNENNLRSLCHACHTRITKQNHSAVGNILQPIWFDSNGYPVTVDTVGSQ